MDIKRTKLGLMPFFVITIYFWLLPLSIHIDLRGIIVKTKISSDADQEITVLRLSRMVIACGNEINEKDLESAQINLCTITEGS